MQIQQIKRQMEREIAFGSEKCLLAVSTGVDSMVLLTMFQQLQSEGVSFGVVHFNHCLREASEKEAHFLTNYCQQAGIPFFMEKWTNPPEKGIEAAAREARYRFFAETMNDYGYQCLLTAHHSDDQIETMLMKMTREGNLKSAAGIAYSQPFADGKLIRPLLMTSKAEIRAYAEQENVPFFEDESNQELTFQRNRIRHCVIPTLKAENPQALVHYQQLSQQLFYANAWISEQQTAYFDKLVTEEKHSYHLSIAELLAMQTASRFFFVSYLLRRVSQDQGFALKDQQTDQLLDLLAEGISQWRMDLGNEWQAVRAYDQLFLQKKSKISPPTVAITLTVGQGVYLSETEWVGIFPINEIVIPEKVKGWHSFSQKIKASFPKQVQIRRRQPGDRIRLAPGLSKKIRRWFIDEKIPSDQRASSWIIADRGPEVLGVVPYVFSYLCIAEETDKIHYILLYKYQK